MTRRDRARESAKAGRGNTTNAVHSRGVREHEQHSLGVGYGLGLG